MRPQFLINTDIVVKYLLEAQDSLTGISALDICAATGLSRSTVYRVLKVHPAIVTIEMPGRKQLWRLDTELLSQDIKSGREKTKELNVRGDVLRYLEHVAIHSFLHKMKDHLTPPEGETKNQLQKDLNTLAVLANYSGNTVSEIPTEPLVPEDIYNLRKGVEGLLVFSAMIQVVLTNLTKDPKWSNDSKVWELFIPKYLQEDKD